MKRAISKYPLNENNRLIIYQASEAFKKWDADMKRIENNRHLKIERELLIERLQEWRREQVEETIRIRATCNITYPNYITSSKLKKEQDKK
jgi:hypothetical protein